MRALILQYLPLLAICLLIEGLRARILLPLPTPIPPLVETLLRGLGFHAFLVGLVCLLLSLRQSRATEILAQIVLGFVALTAIVLELIALLFAYETNLALDHHLFSYVAMNFWMVLPVIFSEVDSSRVTSLAILAVALVGFRAWQIAAWSVGPVSTRRSAGLAGIGLAVIALPALTTPYWVSVPMPVGLVVGSLSQPVEMARESELAPHSANARLEPIPGRQAPAYDHIAIIALESTGIFASSLPPGQRDTTPYLRSLADSSLSFSSAYAVVPHSSKAVVAIACGIVPYLRMEVRETEALPVRCLPSLLGEVGFASLYLGSHTGKFEDRRALTHNMGFERTLTLEDLDPRGFEVVNYFSIEDDAVLPPLSAFLEEHRDERSFVFVLTSAAHHDYRTTSRYPMQDFSPDEVENRYLNNVYHQDRFLEKLVARYREAGIFDETLFVIVGDHGEAFGEHGREQHDAVMYEETMRVPLLFHAPGIAGGSPDAGGSHDAGVSPDAVVSQLDILPTIAELLGYEIVGGSYDGSSVFERSPDSVVFGACWYTERCLARISRERKLISHLGHLPSEAFDLRSDPRESRDLFEGNARDEALENELREWKAQQLRRFYDFLEGRRPDTEPD